MGNSLFKMAVMVAIAACVAAGASAQQTASVTVTGQKNASSWFRAESQHFIVLSDTSNEDVTQLLNNLEKLDYVLRIYTRDFRVPHASGQKLTLYYHNRIGGFNALAAGRPAEAVGLYNSCGAGVQGFAVHLQRIENLRSEQLIKHSLNESLSYIFEAYTRHFLYRYTDIRSPVSYIDGFAQYFSSARFADNHMVLGRAPNSVARFLNFLDNGRAFRLSYEDIIEPKDGKDFANAGDAAVRLEYLAKSWLLTHYMLANGANQSTLGNYLELVHQDVPAAKAFQQAFGLSAEKINTTMWRYQLKGVQAMQIDLPSPVAQISFSTYPDSVTTYLLADAALKSCPGRKDGEAILSAISGQAGGMPNNALPNLALSRAQIDWGNAQDALPYLNEAIRKDASNADAFYLLGLANLRLADKSRDDAREAYLQAASSNLSRARSIDPRSAEAAFAFYKAEISASDQPSEPALKGAVSAWRNAHEVNTYARSAALALAYLGRAPEADNALALLAHNARDPEMASWAKTWQGRLNTGVSRVALVAEMRREPNPQSSFKEWTVASANLMQTVQHNAGLEDARNYLQTLRLSDPTGALGIDTSQLSPSSK